MKTVYLIGNGFDLNLDLKTRYSNFYDWLPQDSDSDAPTVSLFKKDVNKEPENWSDLELRLGQFVSDIEKAEQANLLHDFLIEKLSEYLSEIENSWTVDEKEKSKLVEDLLNPTANGRILQDEGVKISSYREKWKSTSPWITNIITFNYTKSLEKILDNKFLALPLGTTIGLPVKLETIEHIHGFTKERMILGVNDTSQLRNESFHSVSETTDRYVKSDCIATYGIDVGSKCMERVNSADLICIYGMSYGDTDKKWWEAVGRRLANGAIVVLYEYDPKAEFNSNQGPQLKAHKESLKQKFLLKADVAQNEWDKLKKNIIVALNTDMFKLNIDLNKTFAKP